MTQPFRQCKDRCAVFLHDIQIDFRHDYILLTAPEPYIVLSNAVWNGGLRVAERFLNWKVPLDYDDTRPFHSVSEKIVELGHSPDDSIGLQTAAKLTHASIQQFETEHFRMFCMATAGTSNAVRAGQSRSTFPGFHVGTINTMLFIDGRLTDSAMVNAIVTATEAKSAALMDCGIRDSQCGLPATGTTTDAIVVAVSQRESWSHQYVYCGTATDIGHAMERLTYLAISEAVLTQSQI